MTRGMVAVLVLVFCGGMTASASAQSTAEGVRLDSDQTFAAVTAADQRVWHVNADQEGERPKLSMGVLHALYGATAVLQAFDFHSTQQAQRVGAVEANPIMARITGNALLFAATKGAVAASTILLAHQMAKKNRLAAAITLVAINSAYAMVVRQNYRIADLQ